jgi:acetylornithine deacetylase
VQGGRAPNVIPDHAQAEIFFRLVDDGASTRDAMPEIVDGQADLREVLCMPALKFGQLPGFETSVVSYTTDIPAFGTTWGQPYLLGPGSIHVAHTAEERIAKRDILDAIRIYQQLVRKLLNQ